MKTVILLFLLAAFGAACSFGQSAPSDPLNKPDAYPVRLPKPDKSRLRDLKGVVKDDNDQPLSGSVVALKDLSTGKVVEFLTQQSGSYLFYDLNMDNNYELTVSHDGYPEKAIRKLTKYDTRKPAVLNFQLSRKKKDS